jgi:basic amino acid/polyamine antiporter, APA family
MEVDLADAHGLETAAPSKLANHLLRVFGLGFGLAVVIGGVIGSGIMRNPGVVAAGFGSPTLVLLAWLGGGLFVCIDAMPTVELGAAVPQAGGPYPLATRALGPFWGFIVGWADWLQICISTGFITVAFGEYVHRLGWAPGLTTGQLAIGLVIACGAVNWIGAKVSGLSQDLGSAVKAIGLVILVALLFLAHPSTAPIVAEPPPVFTWAAAAVAMRAIYGAYGGWHAAVYFSEEVKNPQDNVARATFLGIALVTSIYFLVNAAVLHVLPISVLAHSTLAVADAAKLVIGPASSIVVTALAMIAVATLANLQVMEHARTTFAMARNGILPPVLAPVSKSGTPRRSLVAALTCTCLIILAADSVKGPLYEILLNLYAPMVMVVFFLLSVSAIRLRRTEPDLPRPWKMPLFPLPAVVSATLNLMLLAFFLISDWKTGIFSAILLALAIPIYLFGRGRWRDQAVA